MTDGLFSSVELGSGTRVGYRLQRFEVFNWGTFDNHVWSMEVGGETALITGDIGSGKSTLVDGLTTLLLPAHRIAYNKAAGAEAKERTLRSYVEGHYKSERSDVTGKSKAVGLRTAAPTYSVLLAVFANEGYDEQITIAQVFQQRERVGQPYRFYVTAPRELSIAADFADFGSDLRDLRKQLRERGAEHFDDYQKYSVSFRRLLGIKSEQALELLHQTVSMKSVGNLNDFVRDHMLERSDATEKIQGIVRHFEDLTSAHNSVKRAREQLELLNPLAAAAQKYDDALAQRNAFVRQREAVRPFIAQLRAELYGQQLAELAEAAQLLQAEEDRAQAVKAGLSGQRDKLVEERARAGGDRIGELEREEQTARREATERRAARERFAQAVAASGLDSVEDAEAFGRLLAEISARQEALSEKKRNQRTDLYGAIDALKRAERRHAAAAQELASLEERTNNIPAEQIELRAALCAALGVSEDEVPFAGELLDVREEHSQWRGAAERVLRGFALSLLVPQRHYAAVTEWVNATKLEVTGRGGKRVGARLVYERVPEQVRRGELHSGEDALLAEVLEVKQGDFRDFLTAELAKRADYVRAETVAEFRTHGRAVTAQGQVRNRDHHEKDDRFNVDDPRHWVMGWANERKVAAVRDELAQAVAAQREAEKRSATLQGEQEQLEIQLRALATLGAYQSWSGLDWQEAQQRAESAAAQVAQILQGSSRLAEIDEMLQQIRAQTESAESELTRIQSELIVAEKERQQAQRARQVDLSLLESVDPGALRYSQESYPALRERLGKQIPLTPAQCASAESSLNEELIARVDRLNRELGGFSQNLQQQMSEVLHRWEELRADLDANVESRAEFVALRDRVASDDLPQFEARFKDELNRNAIKEIASFKNWLEREAQKIDERVEKINQALSAVPYNPGRFVRLEKERTAHTDVAQFRADLRNLTDDVLGGEDNYSEQRFLEVKKILERFQGRAQYSEADKKWSRYVTDVRNWFVFSASERDKETDQEWEHYSDSDGKSGGQKEKLAYTILAASLAYQFGLDWGVDKAKDFRFAVIDEAFGRGSDVSTRYALDLFAKLGLQLLIVTPLQKVQVIEPFVQTIGFVGNPSGQSSEVVTLTIEEFRERRYGK